MNIKKCVEQFWVCGCSWSVEQFEKMDPLSLRVKWAGPLESCKPVRFLWNGSEGFLKFCDFRANGRLQDIARDWMPNMLGETVLRSWRERCWAFYFPFRHMMWALWAWKPSDHEAPWSIGNVWKSLPYYCPANGAIWSNHYAQLCT